ncbi:hypothetical protein ABZX30_27425 [Streptomyces sp. NPDC004542]|uniref:hypothetical protein n=1 Tax=Streptomyces sp. NPDC004542 TaxID=3154281 RepID=UPI0033B20839
MARRAAGGTKLREVAQHVVRSAHEGRLPEDIDHALRTVLTAARRTREDQPPRRDDPDARYCAGAC